MVSIRVRHLDASEQSGALGSDSWNPERLDTSLANHVIIIEEKETRLMSLL